MGIYDRDYIRRQTPVAWSPLASTRHVIMWLVLINLFVYLFQIMTLPPRHWRDDAMGPVTDALAMSPGAVFDRFQIWRLLTGAFLHSPSNPFHLIWNMLFLWFFGKYLEESYSAREFLAFYMTAGVLGNLAWGITALWGPKGGDAVALGASGAVMAVVVLCACRFPQRTLLFMFMVPIPFWAFAVMLVSLDLYHFLMRAQVATSVAVAAHLAGAGFGFLYYQWEWQLTGAWSRFAHRMRRGRTPRIRDYPDERPVAVAMPRSDLRDEQLEAKADEVLAKVSREGMDSLTSEERAILQRASEQAKRRRM